MNSNSAYQKYPNYRESNTEWIGMVPGDWEIAPLKALLFERKEKNYPVKTENILSLSMHQGVIPYADKEAGGNKSKSDLSAYNLAYPGDIVMNSMNVIAGSVGLSEYFGAISPVYYAYYKRDSSVDIGYVDLIFQSEAFQKSLLGLGNGILVKTSEESGKMNTIRMRIPAHRLKNLPLPYPKIETQKKIKVFLIKKCGLIDQLIQKKRRLIELLYEKRQALITQGVTKGLDSKAKMKDSGSMFIGSIPNNWEIKKVRYALLSHRQGYYSTESYTENGYKLLRITDFNNKAEVDTSQCPKVEEEGNISEFQLKKGDFVFARTGGAGSFGYIDFNEKYLAYASYLIRFRFHQKYNTEYIKWCFLSKPFIKGVQSRIHGSVNQNVHAEDIKDQMITFPSNDEQAEIVDYLKKMVNNMDTAIEKIELQIEKLNEFKSSLIYNVVTGKIKV